MSRILICKTVSVVSVLLLSLFGGSWHTREFNSPQDAYEAIQEVTITGVAPTPEPVPAPTPEPAEEPAEPDYTDEDVMCLANMIFGEISAIAYDDSYTEAQQNLAMQQWARVAINHVDMGLAESIPELMKTITPSGYYIWHRIYGTHEYEEYAVCANGALYERCRINAMIALENCMEIEVPSNVIYADMQKHGTVYWTYNIDTGYYRSTVYLCYA